MNRAEAINALAQLVFDGKVPANKLEFAQSLVKQYQDRNYLSEKQWYWVGRLVEGDRPREVSNVGDLSGLIALFNAARDHLKYPKIRLMAASGQVVVLSVAGEKSSRPGTITVVDEGRYPDNKFFGRLNPDGCWEPGRAATDEVIALLRELAQNPAETAAAYGKLTGNCCFCRKPLSDERSTAVGYGGTCAKHFNLPWGAVIYTQAA